MFTICPDCGNDKLKTKIMEKREYDPATTRATVHEEIPVVEYHCHVCNWTALVEDPGDVPTQYERDSADKLAGNRAES